MTADLAARIQAVTGKRPSRLHSLAGGCIAQVYRVDLEGGGRLVAKAAGAGESLEPEAWMLRYLAEHSALPVPAVIHGDDDLLLMEFIETGGRLDGSAQEHAADLLAALHGVDAPDFGLERDTLIGPLVQPNPRTASWLAFFRDQRLLHMGRVAMEAGRLPAEVFGRIERFAGALDRWLAEPGRPSLIHGDMWGGNVLTRAGADGRGRIAAFIDPAIHYADPEIELAFSTLFSTFSEPFFKRYGALRPLAPGFFEERRDIYNLYPLLVHVRLFGGAYVGSVGAILRRFGF